MAKPIKLNFCNFANFGDALCPYLIRHLTGREVVPSNVNYADLQAVGSVFFDGGQHFGPTGKGLDRNAIKALYHKTRNLFMKPLVVWGSGFLFEPKIPKRCFHYRKLDIRAVRGKTTKALLEEAGYKIPEDVVLGDPGLLYPDLIDYKRIAKKFEIGIVPNYDDTKEGSELCALLHKSGYRVRLIDVMQEDPLNVLREIAACEKIIASAMHAMIVSDAMGIPNVLINFPNYNEWKVNDYYSAFGISLPYVMDYNALLLKPYEEIAKIPQRPYINSLDIAVVKEKLKQVLFTTVELY